MGELITWGLLHSWAAQPSGSSYGNGSGYSYGDGYGSGDGSGDGYSYRRVSLNLDEEFSSAFLAYWKSDNQGLPANGGSGKAVTAGMHQSISGPLSLCGPGALHATLDPAKWRGQRLWLVALHGEIAFDTDKVGALERTILRELCKPNT